MSVHLPLIAGLGTDTSVSLPLIVGVTPITGGTNGNVLVDTNGILGETTSTGDITAAGNNVFTGTNTFTLGLLESTIKNDGLHALGLDATDIHPVRISNNNGYVGWTVGSAFSWDASFYVWYSDLTQTTFLSTSIDGSTWTEPYVAPQFYNATANKHFSATAVGVQTAASGGTAGTFWAIGSLIGTTDPAVTTDTVHTLYKSADLGLTWTSLGTLPPVPSVGLQPSQYTGITQMADGKMAAVWGRDSAPFKTGIIRWPVTATDTTGVTIPATISSDRAADAQLYSDSDGAILPLRWDTTSGGASSPYAGPLIAFSTDSGVTWVTSHITDVPANDAVRGSSFAVTRKGANYILMAFNRGANGAGQGQVFLWTANAVAFKAAITGGTPATAGALFTLSTIGNVPGHYTGSESYITGQGALVLGTAGGTVTTNADKLLLTMSAGTDAPAQAHKGDVYGLLLDFASTRVNRPLITQAHVAALRPRRMPTILLAQTTTVPYEMHPGTRIVLVGSSANYVRPDPSCQLGDVIEIEKGPNALNILAVNGFTGGGIVYTLRDGVALSADATYTDATTQRKTVRMICTAISGTTSAAWMIDDEQGSLSATTFKAVSDGASNMLTGKLSGSTFFSVNYQGDLVARSLLTSDGNGINTSGDVVASAGRFIYWTNNNYLYSVSNGILDILPWSGTTQELRFGGVAAINKSGAAITFTGSGANLTALNSANITASTTNVLGIGTIELGHATQNTLSASGGVLSIEGKTVLDQTNTLTGITNKTFVAPVLGAATATSINGLQLTSSTGAITITNGKTLSVANTITFTGTDGTTYALPTTGSPVIARTDAAQTFTGVQTFGAIISTSITNSGALTGNTTGAFSGLLSANGGVDATTLTSSGADLFNNTATYTPALTIGQISSGNLTAIQEFHTAPAFAGGTSTPTDFVLTPKAAFASNPWAGISIVAGTDKAFPYLETLASRGSLAAPTVVTTGDLISEWAAIACDSLNHYRVSSLLDFRVIGTVSGDGVVPGQLEISHTDSAGTFAPRVTSNATGLGIGLGGAWAAGTGAAYRLDVANTSTTLESANIKRTDTATAVASSVLAVESASSGTPAAGFGPVIGLYGQSTTTARRNMGGIGAVWTTATDASRTANVQVYTTLNGTTSVTGTFASDGSFTATGDLKSTQSSTGTIGSVLTNSNATGAAAVTLVNSGASGHSFTFGSAGSTSGLTAARSKFFVYDNTAAATVFIADSTAASLPGTLAVAGVLTASGGIVVPTSTPASASAAGTAGTITWDASFIYVCTAANTWKRVAIATW